MTIEIFARSTGLTSLGEFHARFCASAGISAGQERFSDHVAGGRYHKTEVDDVVIRSELADDREFGEYEYAISFDSRDGAKSDDFLDEVADRYAAKLAKTGVDLVRVSISGLGTQRRRLIRRCVVGSDGSTSWVTQRE